MIHKDLILKILEDLGINNVKSIKKVNEEIITFTYKEEKIEIDYHISQPSQYSVWKKQWYSLNISGHNRGLGYPKQEPFTEEQIKKQLISFLKITSENVITKQMSIFDFLN